MDLEESIQIVKKLAQGINPVTEQKFAPDSAYNNPKVIRSLFAIIEQLPRRKKTIEERREQNRIKGLPENTGLRWSAEDKELVANAYRENMSIEKIASEQKRSTIAIVAELEKQGVISAKEAEELGFNKVASRTLK